ncbi:hypothetical protein R1sor_013313 [Riccia sorocarpa]|uniref:Uncharacterized protein n=1 Tax=Riccia sorocarpa TaxID=122646 RepID=A0ABD3HCB0_9MARC
MSTRDSDTDSASAITWSRTQGRLSPAEDEDAMAEACKIHNPEDVARRGTARPGSCAEFSLIFVKLLYANCVLNRKVDFRRATGSGDSAQKRRRDDGNTAASPSMPPLCIPCGEGSSRGLQLTIRNLKDAFVEAGMDETLEETPPAEIFEWLLRGQWVFVEKTRYQSVKDRMLILESTGRRYHSDLREAQVERQLASDAAARLKATLAELGHELDEERSKHAAMDEKFAKLMLDHDKCMDMQLDKASISSTLREDFQQARAEYKSLLQELDDARGEIFRLKDEEPTEVSTAQVRSLTHQVSGLQMQLENAMADVSRRLRYHSEESQAELQVAIAEGFRVATELGQVHEDF